MLQGKCSELQEKVPCQTDRMVGTDGAKAYPEGKTKDKREKIKVEKRNDLSDRLFEFAVRIIEFLKTLPYSPENKTIRSQLSKSACSSGANYEEAQSGSSKADFTNKVRISLREMRESNYWLRIIERTVDGINKKELDFLIKESSELKSILGSIVQKTR